MIVKSSLKTWRWNVTALFESKTTTTKYKPTKREGAKRQQDTAMFYSIFPPRFPFSVAHSTPALVVFKNLYDLMTVDFYMCVNICESNTKYIDKGIISLAFIHTWLQEKDFLI